MALLQLGAGLAVLSVLEELPALAIEGLSGDLLLRRPLRLGRARSGNEGDRACGRKKRSAHRSGLPDPASVSGVQGLPHFRGGGVRAELVCGEAGGFIGPAFNGAPALTEADGIGAELAS